MFEKKNKEIKKLKTFSQFKIEKIAQISKVMDKKMKIFNNLFTDLKKAVNPFEGIQNLDFYKKNIQRTNSALIKENSTLNKKKNKLVIKIKKPIKNNISSYIKKCSSTSTSFSKTDYKKSKIKYYFNSSLNNRQIHYNDIHPLNMKKANFLINNKDKENKEKYLFKKKLNYAHKISFNTFNNDDSKNNKYNTFYNNKEDGKNQKTFITQLKSETQTQINKYSLLDKIRADNYNLKKLKKQQSFVRKISKNVLIDYINDSSNIFNEQYNKFVEEEDTIASTLMNIKNKLEESERNKSLNNQIDGFIKEDIDIPRIRRNMKLFINSKKQRISFKSNDLFKSPMITKKVADIVNCWDTFSKINDVYFYKNQKAFFKIYPTLSNKAKNDPNKAKNEPFIKKYSRKF